MKKHTTKIFFFILLLSVLNYTKTFSQVIVNDPFANAQLQMIFDVMAQQAAQDAANTAEQLSKLQITAQQITSAASSASKTLEVLQKTEELLVKIGTNLTTVVYVKNMIQREKEIIRMQKEMFGNVQKMQHITAEELLILNNHLLLAVRTTSEFIVLANQLFTDGFFKMDEHSRIEELFSIDNQLAIQQALMKSMYIQYTILNEERSILGAVRKF
jgi:ribosomal protein L16/L10AE